MKKLAQLFLNWYWGKPLRGEPVNYNLTTHHTVEVEPLEYNNWATKVFVK